jgi:Rps23 Pro-64 3,4-dihydroxylase Tpa1-like proline 4-hydroxylase
VQSIPAFYFDPRRLAPIAARAGEAFRTARPFQHVVLDDFLPQEVLALLVREFPGPADIDWEMHGPGRTAWKRDKDSAKLSTSDETKFGPFTRHFMGQLNSATFLAFLEDLTGARGILPDVTYGHCGLHSTGRGGRLMMHTDVNRHPHGNDMHQYLNLILYLNEDWKEEYGGHLELWDRARTPVQRILPSANRVVLFNTGTRSLHGHPHPLACPPGRRRNSLAVYYYLRERPATEEYEGMQKTVHWLALTEEDRAFARERTARALAQLEGLAGRSVDVPLGLIPFDPPPGMVAPRGTSVPLRFLAPGDLADREGFARRHLAGVLAARGEPAAAFLARHRPVALLGPPGAESVTCLLDGEGEMHVVRGAEARELFWVGYLDEVLASLVGP